MELSREKRQDVMDKKVDKAPLTGSDSQGYMQASWTGRKHPLARSSLIDSQETWVGDRSCRAGSAWHRAGSAWHRASRGSEEKEAAPCTGVGEQVVLSKSP